ncbi:MAG: peptidoglycan-associated lipoprotein Pal [Polaromonas sp.]|uniref:peptidoglycan-associated lipoprotein Pal n=1 Tax=Polaromonas sp. TaxID=1869339 RepID=UPI002487771C|nr:peptidoglycan-associated lipoprotein Pal [Polaromonas sp.]MDI1239365.1 peptidoglycan-associated lipoprotein Pal [Polaromonas sp.]
MKRILISLASLITLTAALVGCSSGVKLNEVPVENRTPVSTAPATGDAAGVSGRDVAPVLIGATDPSLAGPPGAARVIYFDYDSFVVKPEFQATVEAHARFLSANKARKLVIEGSTDERGGREYNLALGQKRAEAVRRALGLLGASDAQIEAVSFGEEKPAATGSDEESYAKNRRAEFNYR